MSRAFLCLVALLVSPLLPRAQAPARDNPTLATGTASIRGRAVDASGKPLSRVEIRAGNDAGAQANGLTDGEGRYALSNLPAGIYLVNANKANYVRTAWGEQRPEGPGRPLTLADGQKLDNINLRLIRSGVITGKIVDEFGDPVTDVFISAMRYQYIQGSRRLTPNGRGSSTNDIGEFRVYGLSPGLYYVSATLRNVAMNGVGTDSTDRSGYAPTFYPGTGNVAEAQRLSIAPGQTATGINLSLLPIQTSRVSGIVTDADGKPMLGGMIVVSQRLSTTPMNSSVFPMRPDGTFTISNLTPGDYRLRVNTPGGPESASADITVNGSDISGVELMVTKPSTIRGRIVFTSSATSAGPPKPTAIDLGAWRDWMVGQQVRSPAKIKDDGTFEISLPAGHVLLRAAPTAAPAAVAPAAAATSAGASPPPPAPWRLNHVIYNDADVGDSGIDVPPNGIIENVIIEMTNHIVDVTGRVTDGDGNVVHDCFVIVFAQDPARWTVQTRYLSVSRPGLNDQYRARLLAGDYYVVAMSDVETNAWTDPEFLSLARERATKFSIADGETKTIDLPLSAAPVF